MITLHLKFKNGKEEFVSVESTEFDHATGELLIGTNGARYKVASDCFVGIWIGTELVQSYAVVGAAPNAAK